MRHTQYSNELLSCLAAGALVEMLRSLCATKGAFAPPRLEYDTSVFFLSSHFRAVGNGWMVVSPDSKVELRRDL